MIEKAQTGVKLGQKKEFKNKKLHRRTILPTTRQKLPCVRWIKNQKHNNMYIGIH